MRALWLRAAVAAVLLAGVASCTDDTPPAGSDSSSSSGFVVPSSPIAGGTLRLGVERLPSLDPALASPASQSSLLAADLLYDGLPALSASVTPSSDFAVWTFVLRPGVVFANGRPVLALDVKSSLERVVQQGVGSLAGSRLEEVKGYGDFLSGYTTSLEGVVAVDEVTVEISLDAPFAVLPEVLSMPAFGIVAADALDIGSGPYRVVGSDGDVLRLGRVHGAEGYLDGIDLHQYDDLEAPYSDFEAGRLDWSLVPRDHSEDAAAPFQATLFYAFNLLDPKYADVRFRQAIVKAIDRAAVVQAVYGDAGRALGGVVPAGVDGHVADPCGSVCVFDPAGARSLLAEAFPAGGPPVPTVNLDYFAGTDEESIAVAIEADLVAVGIPVTRRAKSDVEYDQFVTSGQQELFRFGWIGGYSSADAYLTALFKSGSRDNVTGFASADVDALLASARAAGDPAARAALYQQADAALMQQVPIIPLAQFQTRAMMSPRVQGLELRVDGTFDAAEVWLVP